MNKTKISFKDYAIIRLYLACRGDRTYYYNATCFIFANINSTPKAFCSLISSCEIGNEVQKFHVERYCWPYEELKLELKYHLDTHNIHTPWHSYYNTKSAKYSTIYFRVPIYHLSLTTHQIPHYYANDKRLMSLIREILIRIGKSVTSAIVNGVEET